MSRKIEGVGLYSFLIFSMYVLFFRQKIVIRVTNPTKSISCSTDLGLLAQIARLCGHSGPVSINDIRSS